MKLNQNVLTAALAGLFAAGTTIPAKAAISTGSIVSEEKEKCSGKDKCEGKEKKELTSSMTAEDEKEKCSGKDKCEGKDKEKEGNIL